MQVNNIMAGLSDASSLAKGRTSAAATDRPPGRRGGHADGACRQLARRCRAILAKYDVTDITPNEFSQMIQQLYAAGAISQTGPARPQRRADRPGDGRRQADDIDQPAGFLHAEIQRRAEPIHRPRTRRPSRQQIAPLVHRLDWVEKFKTMKDDPAGAGL